MTQDSNLQFIREKVGLLQNAIMYVSGNGLVKLGNNIVKALTVDEEGQLWFLTNRPAHPVEECEQSFPARLHFFRKGVSFYMEISGKATIVNRDYAGGDEGSKKVLVKLAMRNIEYTEPHSRKVKSRIESLVESWYGWFLKTLSVPHEPGSVLKRLRHMN